MIKINELRLGNFLKYGDDIITVTSIFRSHFICERLNGVIIGNNHQNNFQPIPLTPDTISKCTSLKLVDSNEWWDCYQSENGWYIAYAKHTEALAGIKAGNFYQGNGFRKVDYIHDLQNLYFCTSFKKELEFIW